MPGNARIFISHSHDDNARCQPLLDALAQWGVDFWFDRERMDAGQHISQRIQNAITERDLFIRVCSTAVQSRPFWVNLETDAFLMLMGEDENTGQHGKRRLISLVLDAGYKPLPFERVALIIHAHNQSREVWLADLRKAVLPAGGMPRPAQASGYDRVVDWRRGAGDHTTISDAIAAAQPGERILVRAGIYHEGLMIEKPLEIVGDGALGDVVIEAVEMNALRFHATNGRATNLLLRQFGTNWSCLRIERGRLELDRCDISSEGPNGIFISEGSIARIFGNNVHHCEGSGICIDENGHAVLEDNDISDNVRAGIQLLGDANPIVRHNRIHNNGTSGLVMENGAMGVVEDNEIYSNEITGIEVSDNSSPVVRRNRITDNGNEGIWIHHSGGGIFEDNDLRGNAAGAWDVDPDCLDMISHARNLE